MSAKSDATAELLTTWEDGDRVECLHCKLRGIVGMHGRAVFIDGSWRDGFKVCGTNGHHEWVRIGYRV